MEALEVATQAVESALAACDFDPRELERCEERLFALRGMARKYATPVDGLPALAQKYADEFADLERGRGAGRRARRRRRARRPRAYAKAAAALSNARQDAARELERAVNAELPALKLERARFSVEITRDDGADFRRRLRPGGVLRADQSRLAAGAADEGRLGRRTRALSAGAQGFARRARHRADAGFRRDRHRGRRRGRRRDRPAAGSPGGQGAGSRRHPRPAGRRPLAPALQDREERSRQGRTRGDPGALARSARRGARRSRACSRARKSPARRAWRPRA